MKTAGIIAEYNPFHSGHRYQLDRVRALTGADYIIVVMSGDYVQRGEPALYDKYTRTAIALANGADLVLEMPCCFASSSAEDFAACGAALLDRLGVVDILCFGSEAGEISPLLKAAKVLTDEPEAYKQILRARLKDGDSFPKARAEALQACLTPVETGIPSASSAASAHIDRQPEDSEPGSDPKTLFALPNNILGIEYLKALLKRSSRIQPITIRRAGQGYHDTFLGPEGAFPSASAIRNAVKQGRMDYFACPEYHGMDILDSKTPGRGISSMETHNKDTLSIKIPSALQSCPTPVFADDLTGIFNWKLLELIAQDTVLSDFADLSPELEARLRKYALEFASFSGRIEQLKTKQYTYTRISRALLHLLLGITAWDLRSAKEADYVSYARILGFRRAASPLLHRIRQASDLPLITKTADAGKLLDEFSLRQLHKDIAASHLYQSLVFQKSGIRMKNEYTRSVIIQD